MLISKRICQITAGAICALVTGVLASTAVADTVLRIGMSTSDIPKVIGQPDQGYAGNLFSGMTLYDGLTQWDLSSEDKTSSIIPALALSWKVDESDTTKWYFQLRPGVKFHDGSSFNADAVVWNVDKVANPDAPQFDPNQAAVTMNRMPSLKSARKIDDLTVEIVTTEPDSGLPIMLSNLFIASPSLWQQAFDAAGGPGNESAKTQAWKSFERKPAGTGPWKFGRIVPRQRLEVVKNEQYWDTDRIPKLDRLIMFSMPDANARVSALMSGQVDWIESPALDAVSELKSKGFKILANEQPHLWPWFFSYEKGSPWNDVRTRKAANLCIDRQGLSDGLLGGLMVPATGWWEPGNPWYGNPSFKISYDPERGRALMKEAGFGPSKPAIIKTLISGSGSGQMQPILMNEYIQQALGKCYFDVQLQTVDWNALLLSLRSGSKDRSSNGANALQIAFPTMDPMMIYKVVGSRFIAPHGANWGALRSEEIDKLIATARGIFDPIALDKAIGDLETVLVDEARFLFVAHDVGTRAISPKVVNVVQPKNWFIDFSNVDIKSSSQ